MKLMMTTVRQTLYCIMIVGCAYSLIAASGNAPADSSRYRELRHHASAAGATPAILETADALAKEGLYEEAIEILETFPVAALHETSAPENRPTGRLEKKWRVSAGADYYRLEDIDTTVMTREELKDYQRLTQTPLSFWGRGRCAVNFNSGVFEQIIPEVYVSNYRSSFEVPVRLNVIKERLFVETAAKAGKWFQADATGPWQFKPAGSYPSDMGGLSARISPESPADEGRKWRWATPVLVEWEHYREDRLGYESFVEYRFNPTVEYRRSGAVAFSTRLAGDAQYENYYRPRSDSLDVLRGMLLLDNSLIAGSWHLQPKLEWLVDRYFNAVALDRIDRWKAAFHVEQGSRNFLSPQLAAHTLHEREQYDASDTTEHFTRRGTEVRISPSLRVNATKVLRFEPELSYERRWADMVYDDYIWLALSRMEALIRCALTLERLDGSLFAGYRGEDVAADFEHFPNADDSRSFLFGADATVSLGNHLSVNALLDYEYRSYSPYGSRGRMSENLTAAGNLSLIW